LSKIAGTNNSKFDKSIAELDKSFSEVTKIFDEAIAKLMKQ